MRKSVYSLILTTFLATTSFAGDRSNDLLSSEAQQSTHSVVPVLSDPTTVVDTGLTQEFIAPKLRRRNSGNVRGGCIGKGLTRADFKAQQEEESKTKPTHRRRPSGDKGGSGNGGDRGGFAPKSCESHAEFAARNAKPELKKVPSGHHGESAEKPKLKRVPSGHHGESAENSTENSNAFFKYAYQQRLLSQVPLVETY